MLFNTKRSTEITNNLFIEQVNGNLSGPLSWNEFDEVCDYIKHHTDADWYIYDLDKKSPQQTCTDDELTRFITSLNKTIHTQYARQHCGIAFADSTSEPTILKVFNPKLLKSICNVYGTSPIHGWIISRQKPVSLVNNIDFAASSETRAKTKATAVLDARHTGCPLPIINTCRALQNLSAGQQLEVMTIEPGAVKDISIICEQTGDTLISHQQTCDGYSFFVEKST